MPPRLANGFVFGDHPVMYRAYSAAGDLLYIGITTNFPNRQRVHRLHAEWGQQATRWTLSEPYPSSREAMRAERDAIRAERPRHNVVWND